MQGLILAAGMGSRLKHLTKEKPKCMVELNGIPIIKRIIMQLNALDLSRIIIVTGYQNNILEEYIKGLVIKTDIVFVNNPIYQYTNNIYSLSLSADYLLEDDTILIESDLVLEEGILESLMLDERKSLVLVDKYESWMDGTCLELGPQDEIVKFVSGSKFSFKDVERYYKTVNVYKFGKEFSSKYYVPFLQAYSKALGNNEYYEAVLQTIIMLDQLDLRAKRLDGQLWYEIDDEADLDIASSFFAKDGYDKLDKIQKRYGGYWRYPKIIDFCCPVNVYFPPQKMLDEISASLGTLAIKYPSGIDISSLLAAKIYGISKEKIIVGNGITELIKEVMQHLSGKIGIIETAFNEYTRRIQGEKVVFSMNSSISEYNENDLISYFKEKDINTLIISNPDNSTGNYISQEGILKIASFCKSRNICLILDESFVEYIENGFSFLDDVLLDEYSNVVVIRSISEPHGVPGIRLGILASSNSLLISKIKRDISIWNVNSIAEFYMQVFEKYKKQYKKSLEEIAKERVRFSNQLMEIKGIIDIRGKANYLLITVAQGLSARDITMTLLDRYNILVKDLSEKSINRGQQYIRVAIRTEEDNNFFVDCLRNVLNDGRI